jgi:predicted nucleotidyltransferase
MIREKRLNPKAIERLPQLVEQFKQKPLVVAMYLFGSFVHGQIKPLSDIDFAVLLDSKLNRKELFQEQLGLIGVACELLRTDEIDLIVLNNTPPRIAHSILSTGRLLFVKDKNQLVDFTEKVVKLYLDFKPYRKAFDQTFMQGIGLHG